MKFYLSSKIFFYRLARAFVSHELWVARMSRRSPYHAIFIVGTLWIWFFVPGTVVGSLFIYMFLNDNFWIGIVLTIIAVAGVVAYSPWLFHWFYIVLNLEFGNKGPVLKKAKASTRRQKNLNAKIAQMSAQRAAI